MLLYFFRICSRSRLIWDMIVFISLYHVFLPTKSYIITGNTIPHSFCYTESGVFTAGYPHGHVPLDYVTTTHYPKSLKICGIKFGTPQGVERAWISWGRPDSMSTSEVINFASICNFMFYLSLIWIFTARSTSILLWSMCHSGTICLVVAKSILNTIIFLSTAFCIIYVTTICVYASPFTWQCVVRCERFQGVVITAMHSSYQTPPISSVMGKWFEIHGTSCLSLFPAA